MGWRSDACCAGKRPKQAMVSRCNGMIEVLARHIGGEKLDAALLVGEVFGMLEGHVEELPCGRIDLAVKPAAMAPSAIWRASASVAKARASSEHVARELVGRDQRSQRPLGRAGPGEASATAFSQVAMKRSRMVWSSAGVPSYRPFSQKPTSRAKSGLPRRCRKTSRPFSSWGMVAKPGRRCKPARHADLRCRPSRRFPARPRPRRWWPRGR